MGKKTILMALAMMALVSAAGAEDASKKAPADAGQSASTMGPSKEDREKMAKAHEQMAACLRTDQDMKTCMDALHSECKATMGDSCPAMGKGMHKGMRRGK